MADSDDEVESSLRRKKKPERSRRGKHKVQSTIPQIVFVTYIIRIKKASTE